MLTLTKSEYLLTKNGFELVNVVDYQQHSIIFHCKKMDPKFVMDFKIESFYDTFMQSIKYYKNFVKNATNLNKF